MCRQLAIFVLLGLGGMGPHEEHPVAGVDVVGVVQPIAVQIIDRAFSRRTGRMPQPDSSCSKAAMWWPWRRARAPALPILSSFLRWIRSPGKSWRTTIPFPSGKGIRSRRILGRYFRDRRAGWRARENNRYGGAKPVCATHIQTTWRLICKAC
jgi:hypothetical protein